ncbi:TolC family protein [Pedobacter gandavensis]|uniref:TolC family protein n=1 Tax=Pedobacter gandavensis TaxID=2679963 RepID=UPI002479D58F|nr:TolC family protein [Pedobacter gandavensis]WGQ09765.1 TolC family protein [Pedobacter gandavensis]
MTKKSAYYKKMKNRMVIIVGFLLLPILSFAQQNMLKLNLSLAQARALAVEKNPKIAAGELDAKINKEIIAEARLKRIPQVYADANLQNNLIIPVTPVPANAFNPNAPDGLLMPLKFTTRWTSNTGLNANIDLFNSPKKQNLKEALIKEKITKLQNENEANLTSFEVGNAYLATLIAAEQLRLAALDTLTKSKILKISQQQFDEGRLLLTTLNQLKADRNNTLNNFDEATKIYIDSKAKLLYTMGFPPEDNIDIEFSDNLESLFKSYQIKAETESATSISLNQLKQNETLLNTQITSTVKGYLPTLTLKAYYGANYFDNNFDILKSSNWNGNSFVNLGLKLPITEGLDRQKKIKQLQLQKQANLLRYQDERNKNKLDYLAALREAAVLEKNYLRVQENFRLAEKNLDLAEQQFRNGRILITELQQIAYNYQKEKNNYLNMAYNYILAKLTAEKINKY